MNTVLEEHPQPRTSVGRILALPLSARILTDTGFQILFPFIDIWARSLGVTTVQMGRLVGFRNLTGLTSPLWGALADIYGYRVFLRAEMLLVAVGQLLFVYGEYYPLKVAGLLLNGMATFALIPTMQAYVSTRLPYEIRGRGMGILGYAWSLAGIVGVFSVGWLIEKINWQFPYLLLSIGLLIVSYLFRSLPGRTPESRKRQPAIAVSWISAFRQWLDDAGIGSVSARTTIAMATLISYGLMNVVFVFGNWLTTEYDASTPELGTAAMAMGFADLVGSILVTLFTDRIGKKQSVMGGSLASCIVLLFLPSLNYSLVASVAGLMLSRLVIEFALISFFAFSSEQAPRSRGSMLSLTAAFSFGGGSLAGFSGPLLYQRFGIAGPSYASALGMALVIPLGLLFLRDRTDSSKS